MLLLLQLVFDLLRLVVLNQPQDLLVVHHTLNEFALGDFICGERAEGGSTRGAASRASSRERQSLTVLLLPKEFPDFFRPLLRRVFILGEVLLVVGRNHVEYRLQL